MHVLHLILLFWTCISLESTKIDHNRKSEIMSVCSIPSFFPICCSVLRQSLNANGITQEPICIFGKCCPENMWKAPSAMASKSKKSDARYHKSEEDSAEISDEQEVAFKKSETEIRGEDASTGTEHFGKEIQEMPGYRKLRDDYLTSRDSEPNLGLKKDNKLERKIAKWTKDDSSEQETAEEFADSDEESKEATEKPSDESEESEEVTRKSIQRKNLMKNLYRDRDQSVRKRPRNWMSLFRSGNKNVGTSSGSPTLVGYHANIRNPQPVSTEPTTPVITTRTTTETPTTKTTTEPPTTITSVITIPATASEKPNASLDELIATAGKLNDATENLSAAAMNADVKPKKPASKTRAKTTKTKRQTARTKKPTSTMIQSTSGLDSTFSIQKYVATAANPEQAIITAIEAVTANPQV